MRQRNIAALGNLYINKGSLKTKTMKKIKKQNKNNSILMSDGFKFSKLTYLIAKKISFSGNFIVLLKSVDKEIAVLMYQQASLEKSAPEARKARTEVLTSPFLECPRSIFTSTLPQIA